MKQIDIYITSENVSEATQILHKHEVGGITLSEVKGRGRIPHEPVPDTVHAYTYAKKYVPEYVYRTHMSTIVPDSKLKSFIDDLIRLTPRSGEGLCRCSRSV